MAPDTRPGNNFGQIWKQYPSISTKIPMTFFEKKNYPQIHMDSQGIPNKQNNLEKEEKSWRSYTFWFKNLLQSCSNQNSVILS